MRKRPDTGRLELVRRERKCLHHYLYLIVPEFGFMHIRIQGWLISLGDQTLFTVG